MHVKDVTKPSLRPYFLPDSLDYDQLPESAKAALCAIIEPTYKELVLAPSSSLERSVGITLCFLLCLEILDQFDIGKAMNFGRGKGIPAGDRDQQIERHLRLLGAKQQAASFLLRLRVVRATLGHDPLLPPVV